MYQVVANIDHVTLEAKDTLSPDQLKEIQQHYKDSKKLLYKYPGYSVHFGFFQDGGNYTRKEYWCHAAWGGHHAKASNSPGFFDLQTRNLRPKINKEFMDFLLSPTESPWRIALDHVTVITDDGAIPGLPVAVVLRNTERTPIKVFMNLMVAGRMKPSWGLDWVWYNFVQSGFSKPSAMILASLFSWDGQDLTVGNCPGKGNTVDNPTGKLYKEGPYMSDQPFYTKMGFYPKDFIEGKPAQGPEDTLANGVEPQPCSCIWNRMRKTKTGELLVYDNIGMYKKLHTNLVRKGPDNLRGIMDCARYGKKMKGKDVQEIEDAFRNEQPIEV